MPINPTRITAKKQGKSQLARLRPSGSSRRTASTATGAAAEFCCDDSPVDFAEDFGADAPEADDPAPARWFPGLFFFLPVDDAKVETLFCKPATDQIIRETPMSKEGIIAKPEISPNCGAWAKISRGASHFM
jgi:hypothetical protein